LVQTLTQHLSNRKPLYDKELISRKRTQMVMEYKKRTIEITEENGEEKGKKEEREKERKKKERLINRKCTSLLKQELSTKFEYCHLECDTV
jgi:hypothetical protein